MAGPGPPPPRLIAPHHPALPPPPRTTLPRTAPHHPASKQADRQAGRQSGRHTGRQTGQLRKQEREHTRAMCWCQWRLGRTVLQLYLRGMTAQGLPCDGTAMRRRAQPAKAARPLASGLDVSHSSATAAQGRLDMQPPQQHHISAIQPVPPPAAQYTTAVGNPAGNRGPRSSGRSRDLRQLRTAAVGAGSA